MCVCVALNKDNFKGAIAPAQTASVISSTKNVDNWMTFFIPPAKTISVISGNVAKMCTKIT